MSFVFPDKELLRLDEVAKLFNVHTETVREWTQRRRVMFMRTPGGHLRIYTDSLRRFGATANAM